MFLLSLTAVFPDQDQMTEFWKDLDLSPQTCDSVSRMEEVWICQSPPPQTHRQTDRSRVVMSGGGASEKMLKDLQQIRSVEVQT